jgi:formylglycine-generating enzyme required for sulfatase activity
MTFLVSILIASTVTAQKPTIEWVEIPAGTFIMGSPTNEAERIFDETQHKVTLNSFKMSKYEVTVEQFKAFIDATGYITDAEKSKNGLKGDFIWTYSGFKIDRGVNWRYDVKGNLIGTKRYNHPVVHVTWNDAKAFADWMGCRLPTEAEWEYACRAGTATPFSTGDNLTTSQANYDGNFPYNKNAKGENREKTMPVGSFAPNAWGLYDMHGNVWEWCSDWYGLYSIEAQTNPKGPESGRLHVFRGGSWLLNAMYCRSAFRNNMIPPEITNDFKGIRLATDN